MEEFSQPVAVDFKTSYCDSPDPITAYQQWWMSIKGLLREANQAKARGQWKKAHGLLWEARRKARDFHL